MNATAALEPRAWGGFLVAQSVRKSPCPRLTAGDSSNDSSTEGIIGSLHFQVFWESACPFPEQFFLFQVFVFGKLLPGESGRSVKLAPRAEAVAVGHRWLDGSLFGGRPEVPHQPPEAIGRSSEERSGFKSRFAQSSMCVDVGVHIYSYIYIYIFIYTPVEIYHKVYACTYIYIYIFIYIHIYIYICSFIHSKEHIRAIDCFGQRRLIRVFCPTKKALVVGGGGLSMAGF